MRALSDHWHKLVGGRWSRRSALEDGEAAYNDTESESSHSPSLLVTDLSISPTENALGTVKTYTFTDDSGDKHEDSGGGVTAPINGVQLSRPLVTIQQSSIDKETPPMGDGDNCDLLGSFASGILDTFEASLALLQKGNSLSRSLPNVFSSGLEVDSTNANGRYSSNISLESTNNDEFLTEDECLSPPIHSQDDDTTVQEKGVAHEWISKQSSCPVYGKNEEEDNQSCSTATEDTPSVYTSSSRRTTLETIETESFNDAITSDSQQQ